MPKEQSIPSMWEKVKDLNPTSIEKLEKTIQDLEEALANKDDRPTVGSKRGKEEASEGPINPKSDRGKEEIEIEEIDSDGVKARKTNSFFERHNMRNDFLNEEGSSIFHRAPHVQIDYMCLLPLLHFTNIVHALLLCRTILPPFFLVLLPAHVSCLIAIQMMLRAMANNIGYEQESYILYRMQTEKCDACCTLYYRTHARERNACERFKMRVTYPAQHEKCGHMP
jgi:hypothetical protein